MYGAGTDVQFVTRRSHARGYYEDISALTQAKSRSVVLTVVKHSPTGPTYERTSRHIQPLRTTSVRVADDNSRSNLT